MAVVPVGHLAVLRAMQHHIESQSMSVVRDTF